jgi:hypothetical protein
MKNGILLALVCLVVSTAAIAAEPPAGDKPLSATAGPAVNTGKPMSATAGPAVNTGDVKTSPPAAAPAAASAATKAPATAAGGTASASSKPSATSGAPSSANRQAAASAKPKSNDRMDLDTTVVTGNRELPKVLYIVPWKKADIGELPAQPFNTLLDEVLTPVDRDVFRREVTYYGAVNAGSAAGGSSSPAGAGVSGERPPGSEK